MDNKDIKKLIDDFIKFVDVGSKQHPNRHKKLLAFLDALGLSLTYVNFQFDDNHYPDPPKYDEDSIRERISINFNDYGYYNCAEDIEDKISASAIIVGDAIDDLVDIYREILKVCWRWENTSVADALFHYETMYSSHWGSHLRHLQLYVFNKACGV